jgi:hypothetical protein
MVTNLWVEEMRKQDRKELRKKRMNWFKFSVLMFGVGVLIGFILCPKSHAAKLWLELKQMPAHGSCANHTTMTEFGATPCWDYRNDEFIDDSLVSFIMQKAASISNGGRRGIKTCTYFKDDNRTTDDQYQAILDYWKPIYLRQRPQ